MKSVPKIVLGNLSREDEEEDYIEEDVRDKINGKRWNRQFCAQIGKKLFVPGREQADKRVANPALPPPSTAAPPPSQFLRPSLRTA